MSDHLLTESERDVNRGGTAKIQSAVIGKQNRRSQPATIFRANGCGPDSRVVTSTFSVQWGEDNVPADLGEMRSYFIACLEWGVGDSIQVAEVDLRQGSHVSVPAETFHMKAWLQELEPDPGIQLEGGGIAPQATLDPDEAFSEVTVTGAVGLSSGTANRATATKTYPQQTVVLNTSFFYRVPPFGDSFRLFWDDLPGAGDITIRFRGGPTSNAQSITEFDAAALGSSEVMIPGGVTHIEVDRSGGPDRKLTPVFALNL